MFINKQGARGKGQVALSLGFSLIEAVLFMVVVGVALVVVLKAFEVANLGSADPVLRRQSLAIAQSLLEEISLKAYSNPTGGYVSDCGNHTVATCNTATRNRFDDVMDYDGFSMKGIHDVTGDPVIGLSGYLASVSVASATLGAAPAYRFSVTVTDPTGQTLALDGYRAGY